MQDYIAPDFNNCALLTIDTQNDFTLPGAPAEIAGTLDVVPSMARLLSAFRVARRPIVHVVRLYLRNGSNAEICRRAMIERGDGFVLPGSEGAELVEQLKPDPSSRLDASLLLSGAFQPLGPGESVMYKPRWGAFYQTELEQHLRAQNINTLVFSGCNFPNCPRTSIYQASERDFRLVLASDGISGLYERGRSEMEDIGVWLMPARYILAAIE